MLQQVAADTLGIPVERVTVRIGDTRLPRSHASIGSATMANAGASVMLAAKAARDKAIEMARIGKEAPFVDSEASEVSVSEGKLMIVKKNLEIAYSDLLVRNGLTSLTGDGNYDPSAERPKAIFSFSAVFAEVRVDPDFGLVRLNRFVGVYDCGRVINPKPPAARLSAASFGVWGRPCLSNRRPIRRWVDSLAGISPAISSRRTRTSRSSTYPSRMSLMMKRAQSVQRVWRTHGGFGRPRDCQCRLPCDGQESARPADYGREALVICTTYGSGLRCEGEVHPYTGSRGGEVFSYR